MAKNMVKVKGPKMNAGAAGGLGRIEKSAAAGKEGKVKIK